MTDTNTLTLERARHKAADDLIRAIYEKRTAWAARQAAFGQKLRAAYVTVGSEDGADDAWARLVGHLTHGSALLNIEPALAALGPMPGNTGLDALLQLARRHADWLRPVEDWTPTGLDARSQIGSLARHLLARYPVPAFFDAAWFAGFTAEGASERDWFVHLGVGHNLRRAALPVHLTEKMAHHALLAPADFSIVGALRWGQIHGLGGGERLALAVAESRLARILPDEPFWESVLHFFVNNPALPPASIGPLVDFIFLQKFGEGETVGPDGLPDFGDAPEPDFSMKGRTLPALEKRVREWHEILAKDAKRPRAAWEAAGWDGFAGHARDSSGADGFWTVTELKTSEALRIEGREMRHCVFSYASGCLNGTTSIWSLRVRPANDIKTRRLLTVEVNNHRRAVVQVRGKANQSLGAFRGKPRMQTAGEILRQWAREQRLTIACSLG